MILWIFLYLIHISVVQIAVVQSDLEICPGNAECEDLGNDAQGGLRAPGNRVRSGIVVKGPDRIVLHAFHTVVFILSI